MSDAISDHTTTQEADETEQEKAQRWETILRLSKGEICLKWPSGQLLCPHYATWDADADDDLKVYIPQGDGKIVTGESATRMVACGLENQFAILLNRRETPFEERDPDV